VAAMPDGLAEKARRLWLVGQIALCPEHEVTVSPPRTGRPTRHEFSRSVLSTRHEKAAGVSKRPAFDELALPLFRG
jgi:hypothetical protein